MANSYVFYANKNGRPTGLPGFVGPKGPQGEQGEQGIQGPQGEPGEVNIDDASITTESTWSSSKTHTEIEAVAEMAGGKTKTYIISDTDNPNFNSQVDRIGAASLVDISGNTIDIDDLNYGDIILVTQTDVPDRWVAGYTGTNRDFYKMETQKIDLTNYLTKANPVATGSFSIGRKDDSTVGTDSVAMGSECVASGNYSVALGNHSEATAAYAFASGWYGKAYNTAAIAGGRECTAKGEYSTAVGTGNTTGTLDENMVAIGRYGVEHGDGAYALTVGNGTGWSDRKDMVKLDWNGNLEVSGDVTAKGISLASFEPTYSLLYPIKTLSSSMPQNVNCVKHGKIACITFKAAFTVAIGPGETNILTTQEDFTPRMEMYTVAYIEDTTANETKVAGIKIKTDRRISITPMFEIPANTLITFGLTYWLR